jgi:predicted Zn-ribbon and HTH transcriptional regulator
MTLKKFQCEDCGYYWEIRSVEHAPRYCPVCESYKIHRAAKHKRFAKKSRQQIRRSYTSFIGGRL